MGGNTIFLMVMIFYGATETDAFLCDIGHGVLDLINCSRRQCEAVPCVPQPCTAGSHTSYLTDEVENCKRELQTEKDERLRDKNYSQTTNRELHNTIKELKNKLSTSENSNSELHKGIKELQDKLSTSENSNSELHKGIKELQNKLTMSENTNDYLENTNKDLQNKLTTSKKTNNDLEKTNKDLQNNLTICAEIDEELLYNLTKMNKSQPKEGENQNLWAAIIVQSVVIAMLVVVILIMVFKRTAVLKNFPKWLEHPSEHRTAHQTEAADVDSDFESGSSLDSSGSDSVSERQSNAGETSQTYYRNPAHVYNSVRSRVSHFYASIKSSTYWKRAAITYYTYRRQLGGDYEPLLDDEDDGDQSQVNEGMRSITEHPEDLDNGDPTFAGQSQSTCYVLDDEESTLAGQSAATVYNRKNETGKDNNKIPQEPTNSNTAMQCAVTNPSSTEDGGDADADANNETENEITDVPCGQTLIKLDNDELSVLRRNQEEIKENNLDSVIVEQQERSLIE